MAIGQKSGSLCIAKTRATVIFLFKERVLMQKKLFSFLLLACFAVNGKGAREMIVSVPVANLRALDVAAGLPKDLSLADLQKQREKDVAFYQNAPSILSKDNPLQESHLLFGERVFVDDNFRIEGWYKVQALEQKIFSDGIWRGCPGFVRANCLIEKTLAYKPCLVVAALWADLHKKPNAKSRVIKTLSLGSCLSGVRRRGNWWIVDTSVGRGAILATDVFVVNESIEQSEQALRDGIVGSAKKFLGSPYIWGGCSAWKDQAKRPLQSLQDQVTGVDCSSLMYLAYKSYGLLVPRNSHDQYLMASPLASGAELRSGDVIFFANPQRTPPRVTHVVMYGGKDERGRDLIVESGGKLKPYGVYAIPTADYIRLEGKSLDQISNGYLTHWLCEGKETSELVYLGTFFTSDKLQELRREFLKAKLGG